MNSNCILCNKEFEKQVDKHVFCSKKCCDLNYRQTKKGITRVEPHKINCLACSNEILVNNNVRKYCDRKCKNDYKNNLRDAHTMKTRENKLCIICEKSFFPTRLNKSYCSKSCKAKEFRKNHHDDLILRTKVWLKSSVGKEWVRYYNTIPNVKLSRSLRDRMYKAITLQQGHKSTHTKELLGADVCFVREYLASKFKPGMSWENHSMFGWHIDHIIPCASFDLTNPENQKKCFHYTNLQPLWWQENLSKNDKLGETW